MSILCSSDKGWVVSHYDYSKKLYRNVLSPTGKVELAYNENIFKIITPLMKDQEAKKIFERLCSEPSFSWPAFTLKRCPIKEENDFEVNRVKDGFLNLIKVAHNHGYFINKPSNGDYLKNNSDARHRVDNFVHETPTFAEVFFEGGNQSENPIIVTIEGRMYLIPPKSFFISCDISNFYKKLEFKSYDFILLDPPWQNKHVRRKRKRSSEEGYQMLFNNDISQIPVDKLLNCDGLVGVWCTNSPSHIEDIKESFFPKWGLDYIATWFWLKITVHGEAVCSFEKRNGKKPYERLIFGGKKGRSRRIPEEDKLIMSVPSAFHSHKPPLTELLQEYLPEDPQCLELFARYLLPGWTSVGNQVLYLQSLELYEGIPH